MLSQTSKRRLDRSEVVRSRWQSRAPVCGVGGGSEKWRFSTGLGGCEPACCLMHVLGPDVADPTELG